MKYMYFFVGCICFGAATVCAMSNSPIAPLTTGANVFFGLLNFGNFLMQILKERKIRI